MKQKFTALELLIVLAILLTVMLGAWQYASAAKHARIDKDSDVELQFDWGGKDVNGQDVTVVVAEFVLRADPPGSPPLPAVRILTTMAPVVGTNTHIARQIFVGTVIGEYLMTVRVKSDSGAFSAESNILPIEITAKKPAAPLRLRVGGR